MLPIRPVATEGWVTYVIIIYYSPVTTGGWCSNWVVCVLVWVCGSYLIFGEVGVTPNMTSPDITG